MGNKFNGVKKSVVGETRVIEINGATVYGTIIHQEGNQCVLKVTKTSNPAVIAVGQTTIVQA